MDAWIPNTTSRPCTYKHLIAHNDPGRHKDLPKCLLASVNATRPRTPRILSTLQEMKETRKFGYIHTHTHTPDATVAQSDYGLDLITTRKPS